jgi:hypothetical protein
MSKSSAKGPLFFDVPANAQASQCRGCGKYIYWVITDAGKRMPVDTASEHGGADPDGYDKGKGVSHFATCPAASQFRRGR